MYVISARDLAVYGATGPGLLIQHVLAKGHFVTAVVRNPNKQMQTPL